MRVPRCNDERMRGRGAWTGVPNTRHDRPTATDASATRIDAPKPAKLGPIHLTNSSDMLYLAVDVTVSQVRKLAATPQQESFERFGT